MSLNKILSALSDERRMKVVKVLRENGSLTIRELSELVGEAEGAHSPQIYGVMRSVDVLEKAGVVEMVGKFPYRVALIPGVVEEAGRKLTEMNF